MKDHESPGHHRLYSAIASLQTPEECRLFFEDICTIKELQSMAQRLEVAALLAEGQNYYGGGYRIVLDRLKEENP